ncbi:FHA domain-containing protein [Alienimonas sp. DA493]|uniref:FHA domain-containing protein n=1 Tax=Alienimonas sp. DA493 TaxID=3373605 RepID=UPI00375445E0
MADLLVDSGKHRGRRLKLAVGQTLIGRDRQCAIRLATPDVSRQHCRLTVALSGGREVVTAEDLKSRNGTYINGRAIRVPTVMGAGDTLRVGPIQFLLPDPDAASESEVITWLVPPPAPGTVSEEDEPTQVVGGPPPAPADSQDPAPPPPEPEPEDEYVQQASALIRARYAARKA